jgi:endonuclease/exonuclease/phosphatase family metal-dependent hydrolase
MRTQGHFFLLSVTILTLSCSDYQADLDLKNQQGPEAKEQLSLNLPAGKTVKVMTYNVLSDPLCRDSHKQNMHALADFIKQEAIGVAGLQEVLTFSDSDCKNSQGKKMSVNHGQSLLERFNTHKTESNFQISLREKTYVSASQGSQKKQLMRVFLHTDPLVSWDDFPVSDGNSQGAESIVVKTALGEIRFVNLHPQPGKQALALGKSLEQYINHLKKLDSLPIVILGDFNLRYDYENALSVLKSIESLGFYRACNPARFPLGNCNDTVRDDKSLYAIDHVFIDQRANFVVRNAYVAQNLGFSDHLPLIVELEAPPQWTKVFSAVSPAGDRALIHGDELGKFKGLGWTVWGEGGVRDEPLGCLFIKPEDTARLPPRLGKVVLSKVLMRGLIKTTAGLEDRMSFFRLNYLSSAGVSVDYPGASWMSQLGYTVQSNMRSYGEFVQLKQLIHTTSADHAVALEHDRARFYKINYRDVDPLDKRALPADLGWIIRKGSLGCQ